MLRTELELAQGCGQTALSSSLVSKLLLHLLRLNIKELGNLSLMLRKGSSIFAWRPRSTVVPLRELLTLWPDSERSGFASARERKRARTRLCVSKAAFCRTQVWTTAKRKLLPQVQTRWSLIFDVFSRRFPNSQDRKGVKDTARIIWVVPTWPAQHVSFPSGFLLKPTPQRVPFQQNTHTHT